MFYQLLLVCICMKKYFSKNDLGYFRFYANAKLGCIQGIQKIENAFVLKLEMKLSLLITLSGIKSLFKRIIFGFLVLIDELSL